MGDRAEEQRVRKTCRRVGVAVGVLAVVAVVGALLVVPRLSSDAAIEVEPFLQCQVEGCVADAVGTSSGRLWLQHEDISDDPVSGAFGIQRTYFRDDTTSSSFGPGWRSILDTRLETGDEVPTLAGFPSLPGAPLRAEDNVVTFAGGTRWTFDEEGRLVAVRTGTGREFTIDRTDGKATVRDGDRTLIEVTYEDGRVAEIVDRRSNEVGTLTYAYDAGRLVEVTSDNGDESTNNFRYGYNPGGGLDEAIDADGETKISWTDGRSVERIAINGQATTIDLAESTGTPTLVTLPGATKATVYQHDPEGRLIEIRQGDSVSLQREYDAEGQLVLERDDTDERRFTWSEGRLSSIESDATGTTDWEWDDLGRLVAVRTNGFETSYEYVDSTWAPSTVTEGEATTTFEYRDAMLEEVTDPDGVTADVTGVADTSLAGGAGALAETSPECDASNDGLLLDAACRPVGLTATGDDPDGAADATVEYDEFGRVASTKGPNGSEVFTYDGRGRVASVTRGGVTYRNEYSHSRLDRVTTDDGSIFAEYHYDDAGRLKSMDSSQGSIKRSYDESGRAVRIEDGGRVWEVTEYSDGGRPEEISTPYGNVSIEYDRQSGRVAATRVGDHGERPSGRTIETTYEWDQTGQGEVATVSRGGYETTFTFTDGKVESATTSLGRWDYRYDDENPDLLAEASGPDGVTRYTYATGDDGLIRLERIEQGDRVRAFEWDELGRLTGDEGGSENRSFEYRPDGITQSGSSGRTVTWGESGLPEKVESDGSTEIWAWNEDRTLRSITVPGGGFPLGSSEQTWKAEYGGDRRLLGFDKVDSEGDIDVTWSESGASPVPTRISREEAGSELSLAWTEIAELRRAGIGEQEWRIERDPFWNVTALTRSGESNGELVSAWHDGVPVGASQGSDSVEYEDCTETDCSVELTIDGRITELEYSESSIVVASGERETEFTRDEEGLITEGCQELDSANACTEWLPDGQVGSRAELARFDELLGGTNGQLRGFVSRPLPVDPPALASLPDDFRPEGMDIPLPDEELDAAIAAAAPSMPETYRLGEEGAEVRVAERLAPTSVSMAGGPGTEVTVELFDDTGLADLESPFGADTSLGAVSDGLAGLEPDSILRGVTDLVQRYGFDALSFVASLFTSVAAGGAALAIAAAACFSGSSSCVALAVTGALMAATSALVLVPGIGPVAGAVLATVLSTIVEAAVAVASSASWQDVGLAVGASLLVAGIAGKSMLGSGRKAARACSFAGSTGVVMAGGSLAPISAIDVGDEVLAMDPETGELGARRVTEVFEHADTLVELGIGGELVTTTEDHPFWNHTDADFQRADALDKGDLVLTSDGDLVPVDGLVAGSASTGTAHNLSVDQIHTYFVAAGDNDVLVHNVCAGKSNYRRLFMEQNPSTPRGHDIHHSLPQKFESTMAKREINIHENQFLRGVDPTIHSRISADWKREFAGRTPTARQVMEFAERIDDKYRPHLIFGSP